MNAPHVNRGLSFRAIGIFAIGLSLLMAASVFLLNNLVRYFETRDSASQTATSGSIVSTKKFLPEPRLQDKAVQDLQQMHAEEDQILNSYGWVDQKKGTVRIPIDRALDLLAQRGLPVPKKHPAPQNAGSTSDPGGAGIASNADQSGAGSQTGEGHQ